MATRLFFVSGALLFIGWAAAIEVATGKILGPGYDPRSFYVREGRGPWRTTYTGKQYRPEAAARLMNLRIAQGIFDDEWLTEAPFDPERNTERLIEALDIYMDHGIKVEFRMQRISRLSTRIWRSAGWGRSRG